MSRFRFWRSLGAVLVAAAAALVARAQETPASQTLIAMSSPRANAHFGTLVAGVGDVNGDGRADYLIGSADALTVYSGATGRPLYLSVPADQPGDFENATAFSFSDSSPGGGTEIVVAAPLADEGGKQDAGVLYRFVAATGQRRRVLEYHPGFAGAQVGAAAALLKDVSGDGRPEVVLGEPYATAGNLPNAGAFRVLSLATVSNVRMRRGETAGERLGSAVAALDDLDGDGPPDIAIGAPFKDVSGVPAAGTVFFYSVVGDRYLPLSLPEPEPNANLGASLANAGDLDGDGHPELIIGAPGTTVDGRAGAGAVFVYSPATERSLFRLNGTAVGEGFGTVVAGGGDFDGDGHLDILVGAPRADVEGRADAGLVQIYSGADHKLLFSRAGNAGDRLGSAAAFVGDLNRDGRADVLIGSPFADVPGAEHAGQAILVTPGGSQTPTVRKLVVSPSNLAFGPVQVETTQTRSLTVHNGGTAPLAVTVGTLTDPFTVNAGAGSFSLDAGADRLVTVMFSPTRVSPLGEFQATLTITSDDPSAPMVNVPVSGASVTGGAGKLALTPGPEEGLLFMVSGRDLVYGECIDRTLVLRNTGMGPLRVSVRSLQQPFMVAKGGGELMLQSGKMQEVVVRFCAPVGGLPREYRTRLVIISSDAAAPAVEVPVRVPLP